MADDRDDTFHDAFGAGRSDDPDRWPGNEEGPAGPIDAPPTGKSNTVKVLLIVLAVIVLAGLLCCGGGVWWYLQNVEQTTEPAKIQAWTQEIVPIEVPADYTPTIGFKVNWFSVFSFVMTFYSTPGGGTFALTDVRGEGANDPQARQQMDAQMRQQGAAHQINVTNTENRTVTINGQEVEFTFATGTETQSKAEWKEVSGTFQGKDGGLVSLKLQQPSANFDEEAVMRMLESIGQE
jgi:hypothetical protein